MADIQDIWNGEWMPIGESFICDMVSRLPYQKQLKLTECVKEFTGCEVQSDDHQLYTCYMNPSTQSVISRLEISLPDGYRFLEDDKQAENYTQIVNDTWRNATPKELEQTR